MKSIILMMAMSVSLSLTACTPRIKNAKTVSVKIYGNCEMCETTIEKAGNVKKIARVDWNKDTKMASITFDTKKTTQDEILKRIALAGYDSDQFLAPDNVYASLPQCCKYERVNKAPVDVPTEVVEEEVEVTDTIVQETVYQLKAVFDNYFALKDALVQSNGAAAALKAKNLIAAIASVKMDALTNDEHVVFMKVMKDLTLDAQHISETKELSHQRGHFTTLSTNMYKLMKVGKQEVPVYYQHCPMYDDGKGANWLSTESSIKNPYYGSQMLNCGKTTETIK